MIADKHLDESPDRFAGRGFSTTPYDLLQIPGSKWSEPGAIASSARDCSALDAGPCPSVRRPHMLGATYAWCARGLQRLSALLKTWSFVVSYLDEGRA